MACRASLVQFVVDQLGEGVTSRAMFGGYGIYRSGVMFALMSRDRLFLKPTETARAVLGAVEQESPYPGAKPHFLVPEDRWDDAELMASLARATAEELAKTKKEPRLAKTPKKPIPRSAAKPKKAPKR